MLTFDKYIEMNKSLISYMKRNLANGLKDWKCCDNVETTRSSIISGILKGVKLDIDSNLHTKISKNSNHYERIYNRIFAIAIEDISKSLKYYQNERNMDHMLQGQISVYDLVCSQMKSIHDSAAVYSNITIHHQRLQESNEQSKFKTDHNLNVTTQADRINTSSNDLITTSNISENSFVAYADAAKAMGDRTWVYEANKYMYDIGIHFYFNGGARKFYIKNMKRKGLNANASRLDLVDDLSCNLLSQRLLNHKSDGNIVGNHRKLIKLLDVGSCYNPLAKFDSESTSGEYYDVTACDLYPADIENVFQCDFLQLKVGPKGSTPVTIRDTNKDTSGTKYSPDRSPIGLTQLPRNSYDMVTMSLVLCYLPSPRQRMEMIRKARALLRDPNPDPTMPHDGGLLVIVEKESIFYHNAHVNHSSKCKADKTGVKKKEVIEIDLLEHWKQFISGSHCHVECDGNAVAGGDSGNDTNTMHLVKQMGGFELSKYHCVTSETGAKNKHKYHMFAFRTVVVPDEMPVTTGMELIHSKGNLSKEVGLYIRQDYTTIPTRSVSTPISFPILDSQDPRGIIAPPLTTAEAAVVPSLIDETTTSCIPHTDTSASVNSTSIDVDDTLISVLGYNPLITTASTTTKSIINEFIWSRKDIVKMLQVDHATKNHITTTPISTNNRDQNSICIDADNFTIDKSKSKPIVGIIGAGISGIILALSLKHFKIPYKIFEKDMSAQSRKQGFGFTIQQASYVLKQLGLLDSMVKNSVVSHSHASYSVLGECLGAYGVHVCIYDALQTNGRYILRYRPEFNHHKTRLSSSNPKPTTNRVAMKHTETNTSTSTRVPIVDTNSSTRTGLDDDNSYLSKKRKRTALYHQRKKLYSNTMASDSSGVSDCDCSGASVPVSVEAAKQNYHIPRTKLRELFLEQLELDSEVHWNKELVGLECVVDGTNKNSIELHFQDGKTESVSLLVGADGIHSNVYELKKQLTNTSSGVSDANIVMMRRQTQTKTTLNCDLDLMDSDVVISDSKEYRNDLNYLNLVAILGISPVCHDIEYSLQDNTNMNDISSHTMNDACTTSTSSNNSSSTSHPLQPRSQHQWLDGGMRQCTNPLTGQRMNIRNCRVFSMPYDAQQTMWQMSFLLDSEEEAKNCVAESDNMSMKQLALKVTDGWHAPIVDIIQNTPNELVSGYVLYDRDVTTTTTHIDHENIQIPKLNFNNPGTPDYSYTPITLIGDASHPMSPFKGQGANQAIIDAWELANTIKQLDPWASGSESTSTSSNAIQDHISKFESVMNQRVSSKVMKSRNAAIKLHSKEALSRGNMTRAAVAEALK